MIGPDADAAARGRWHEAIPELAIAGVAVAAAALAAGAVAGWPGVATVAIAAAALGLLVLRGLVPRSAAQAVRLARDKQAPRAIAGYTQRRFIVSSSVDTLAFYESDLRPILRAPARRPAGRTPQRQPLHRPGGRARRVLPQPRR